MGLTLTSVSAVGSGSVSGSGSAALTFGSTDGSCFSGTARSGVGVGVSASVPRDFGAGAGLYGRYFAKHAPTVRWVGVDGADNVEVATDGQSKRRR